MNGLSTAVRMGTATDRLLERLPARRSVQVGITEVDVRAIPFSEDYFQDVVEAMQSPAFGDSGLGFFYAEHLPAEAMSTSQWTQLAEIARSVVLDPEHGARASAAAVFFMYGRGLANYRGLLIDLLHDSSSGVRLVALRGFRSYAGPSDIELLLPFEHDDYLSEVGIGSHLIFALRNVALEELEILFGRRFRISERVVSLPEGNVAFWWDWEPFHKWRKERSPFWRRIF